MKSFKEWRSKINEGAHVDPDVWGWEISGNFEDVMAEVEKNRILYQSSTDCIFSVIKPGHESQYSASGAIAKPTNM